MTGAGTAVTSKKSLSMSEKLKLDAGGKEVLLAAPKAKKNPLYCRYSRSQYYIYHTVVIPI